MGYPSRFGGIFNAVEFAYGVNNSVAPLQVINGPAASGAGTLTLAFGYITLADGTVVNNVLNTNATVNVGGDSNSETATLTTVSNSTPLIYGSSTIAATFTYQHGMGDTIRSGTCGLQEALNYASSVGGGTVIVSPAWASLGGTQAMLVAATIPANVELWDNRFGNNYGSFTYTLTNTQILNMATTTVQLLPTPGATQYWQVSNANLINLNTGTAYAAGGAIEIGYGSTVATNALSGTVAATFLTTPTATQVIEVGSGLTSSTAGTLVLGKGVYINSTAAFTTGTGTLQVTLNAALLTV